MRLTQKDIDELKEIYRAEYGREISEDAAWEMGERLLHLFGILTGLISTAKPENETVLTASGLTKERSDP